MSKGNEYNHKLPSIDILKKIYFEDGISTPQIAKMFNVTPGAVKIKFNRNGIKLRTVVNPRTGKKSYKRTPEHNKYMSELVKQTGVHVGIPLTDVHKKNIAESLTGEKGPNWKGGISFEPYPITWTRALKKAIRQRDNHTCQLCFNKGLPVHHIDYIKQNCTPDNLITLCQRCNAKVNYNRPYWTEYFTKIIKGRNDATHKNQGE
ncbi:hypothetical protein ES708_00719 [subsurface metagenome]